MRFSDPHWLWVGALACVALVWLWRRYDVRQQAALASFVSPHLRQKLTGSVSRLRRILQRSSFLLAVVSLFGAIAGPELGFHWEKISRRGNEVVFAIDTSRSMLTPDVKPNRLIRAKLAVDDMARQLEGDGIGIVAFAGSAFLVCPLTLDYSAFRQSLDAVDVNTIPLGGTNIASAITAAREALRRRPGSDRILILVTDGENLQGDALMAAQNAAKEDGLKIYTVGMGTADGELIPLPLELGGDYVKDESGELVKSRLDENGLKAIASATGGVYVHLAGRGENFESFLRTVFGTVTKHDLVYRQQRIYNQSYQWPLAASLMFLLASLMVGARRAKRRPAGAGPSAAPATPLGASRVSAGPNDLPMRNAAYVPRAPAALQRPTTAQQPAFPPQPATAPHATASRARTNSLAGPVLALLAGASTLAAPLRSGAADQTNTPASPRLPLTEYNSGTAAYKAGKFSQATQSFQNSINAAPASDAKRLADQQDAYYNLGNSLYRAGQQLEKSAPQEAIAKWTDAVRAYETALQLRADDADSKYNRDFVKRKIESLRQPPDGDGGSGGSGGGGGGGGGGQGQRPPANQNQQPPSGDHGQPRPPAQYPPGGSQSQPPPPAQAQTQPPLQTGGPSQSPPSSQPPPSGQQAAGTNTPPDTQPDDSAEPPSAAGQMTVDEANALLNSAKSDEHHSLLVPSGPRRPDFPPDKPYKNW